jgi:pimeloyl-ACP methyl ester carboxylesterase
MPTITTDHLSIACDLYGSEDAPVVLLLHGWPDDATTWDRVAPRLAQAGLRVVVPTLRGFGATRFRHDHTPRTGDSAILALDAIALMDAIGIDRFMVAGHDWGSNIAEALAVGWPERVRKLALLSTPPRLGGMPTPSFDQAQRQWYHWFMATRRGAQAVRDDRRGFAHVHWVNWSPPGWFDEATFNRVAKSFDNPDWPAVTIHSYRARWDEAQPDPRGAWLADRVKATKALSVPTLYLHGEVDGVNPPSTARDVAARFSGPFRMVELPGVGHFPQRENPEAVSCHLIELFVEADEDRGHWKLAAGVAAAGLLAAAVGFARMRPTEDDQSSPERGGGGQKG